jgi:hypothetical protein
MNGPEDHLNGVGDALSDDEVATMSGGNFAWPRGVPLTRFLAGMAERGLIDRVAASDHDVIMIKGHPAGR